MQLGQAMTLMRIFLKKSGWNGMNGTIQGINPYHRLEFILSLKEASESRSLKGDKVREYVEVTLYDYLYVDIEMGRKGAAWSSARNFLGIGENNSYAIKIGEILDYYFRGQSVPLRDDTISAVLKCDDLISLSREFWFNLVRCRD